LRQDIQIIRGSDTSYAQINQRQLVDAVLLTLGDKHLDDFEQQWKEQLRTSSEAHIPPFELAHSE